MKRQKTDGLHILKNVNGILMKKMFQIVFFCLISFTSFSQQENDTVRKQTKWNIAFDLGLNKTYRKLIYRNNQIDNDEVPDHNFSGELFFEKEIMENFHFRVGTNFSKMSYHSIELDSIYVGSDPLFGLIFKRGKYEFKYDLVAFPAALSYYFPIRSAKFDTYFGMGVFSGFLNEKYSVDISDPSYQDVQFPPTLNPYLSSYFFSGCAYSFRMFKIFIEANYQFSITQQIGARRLYSYGFGLGLKSNL